jgi:hypothetical protein
MEPIIDENIISLVKKIPQVDKSVPGSVEIQVKVVLGFFNYLMEVFALVPQAPQQNQGRDQSLVRMLEK